jgi:hypothetical protein
MLHGGGGNSKKARKKMSEKDPIFKTKPFFQDWIDKTFYGWGTPREQAQAYAERQKQIEAPKSQPLPTPTLTQTNPSYSPRDRTLGIDAFIKRCGN